MITNHLGIQCPNTMTITRLTLGYVRLQRKTTALLWKPFIINGVRHGDILLGIFFNSALEKVICDADVITKAAILFKPT